MTFSSPPLYSECVGGQENENDANDDQHWRVIGCHSRNVVYRDQMVLAELAHRHIEGCPVDLDQRLILEESSGSCDVVEDSSDDDQQHFAFF